MRCTKYPTRMKQLANQNTVDLVLISIHLNAIRESSYFFAKLITALANEWRASPFIITTY